MIGQVRAYAGAVGDHGDAVLAQVLGGTDAGQDHLRLGAGDVLGAPAAVPDADRAAALDHDAGGKRVRLHGQIRPVLGRVEVGVSRRPAPALLLGHLVETDAVLVLPVEVGIGEGPRVDGRLDERRGRGRLELRINDRQRARSAVIGRRAPGVLLGSYEVRKYVVVTPAVAAILVPPGVVVEL